MDDQHYSVRKLIHNDSFRRMVNGVADGEEISRWNRWIEASDENRTKVKEAMAEIVGFEFSDPKNINFANEWERLQKVTLQNAKLNKWDVRQNRSGGLKWWFRVAAILIVGALVGLGMYHHSKIMQSAPRVKEIIREQTIKAGSNEQKTIQFSDGSKVMLNSNSTLHYQISALKKQPIKVRLDGEAYFDASGGVSKNGPVFAVHTPDGVIRDIGTQFLVTVQNRRSTVVLQQGKVELTRENIKGASKKIAMKKGEMLAFNQSRILSKKMVNATFYTSWATGSMQFDHTTLQEFAGYVEKKFDVDVQIADPQLYNIKVDGSIYFNSLAGLVRSVSKVAKIPAYQSKDRQTVYLGDKPNNMMQP